MHSPNDAIEIVVIILDYIIPL